MLADIELARVVTDDHGGGQKAMRLDAAPQRPFGGNHDRIGRDLESGDAALGNVRLPPGLFLELYT